MPEIEQKVRGAVFGGFKRKDVVAFLEALSSEHEAALAALQEKLAAAEDTQGELGRTVAELEAQTAENQRLTRELAERSTALDGARNEMERQSARLMEQEKEMRTLRDKITGLEPAAKAYEEVKNRTAGLELDAHRRAQNIVRQAEEQAERLKAEMEQWIGRVQGGYDALRTDLDATVAHSSNELERARKTLDNTFGEFHTHDEELQKLLQHYREGGD